MEEEKGRLGAHVYLQERDRERNKEGWEEERGHRTGRQRRKTNERECISGVY